MSSDKIYLRAQNNKGFCLVGSFCLFVFSFHRPLKRESLIYHISFYSFISDFWRLGRGEKNRSVTAHLRRATGDYYSPTSSSVSSPNEALRCSSANLVEEGEKKAGSKGQSSS